MWSYTGSVLLEFPPAMAEGKLFLLKNNGALHAIDKRTGKKPWARKLGVLAASSPSYGNGRDLRDAPVAREGQGRARSIALDADNGKILWKRLLPSRSESSPLFDNDRIYFGSENGTSTTCAPATARCAGRSRPPARSRAGSRWPTASSSSATTGAASTRSARPTAARCGRRGPRARTSGSRSGHFYSTPAVAYGRVYIGNTDGSMYSFSSANGKLAWTKGTGSYVYASPAVAQVPGGKPTVFFGSYDGKFYAVDARNGKVLWSHREGGKISGGATVVGDIVYYSTTARRTPPGSAPAPAEGLLHAAAARSTR